MSISFGGLFLSLVIGAVGTGLFIYGKKQGRPPQMIGGLALCIYPYFVPDPWLTVGIAALIIAAVWVAARKGL